MIGIARACAEFLRIVLFFTRPISEYVLNFVYSFLMGSSKPLPPIENKVLLLSAKDLAEKIRKRQVKCEDVMKAYVERSQAVNPMINAVVDARYEGALEDARAVDSFLESQQKSIDEIAKDTPLLGVPFSCKEAIGVKDLTQTCGVAKAKGRVAKKDSDSAALYRKAGAIPVTVTNVPEYCLWWESSNVLFGTTKNPYNHTRTVGGSSGGEGALITAAGGLIGIGNDLGGSIRIPASFCGIYGHKPSQGVVSNFGFYPGDDNVDLDKPDELDQYVSTGPMCRYVEDLPLLMEVLAINDETKVSLNKKVNFRKVKVYYMEEFPGFLTSSVADIRKAVKKAKNFFAEEYGIKPLPLKVDELRSAYDIWLSKLHESGLPSVNSLLGGKSGDLTSWVELIKYFLKQSDRSLPCIYFALIQNCNKDKLYHECLTIFNRLEQKFRKIFEEDAILLLPTHPEPPPHHLMAIPKFPNIAYTAIFCILGFAVTTIPAGMSMGMPIGVQAVSGKNQDHLTIAAAIELDKAFGGWKSPCHINV